MRDAIVRKDAFERWDEPTKLRLIEAFRDAYNAKEGTTFGIYPDSLIDASDFDFRLCDAKKHLLKIQHTFAGADPALEYVGEKLQEAVVAYVRARLAGLKNLFVSLGFRGILKNRAEAEALAKDIETFVRFACNNASPAASEESVRLKHFRYTDAQIPDGIGTIAQLLTSIDIYSNELSNVVISYGGPAVPRLSDDLRAAMAIGSKEEHYASPQDLILIVHYNMPFSGDFYEPIILENHKSSPFLGIWLYDAWKDRFVSVK